MSNSEKSEVDVTTYLEKAPTPLQARFVDYLKTEVGYDPNTAKTKAEAFAEGVRLSVALRMTFQASDFNRNARLALQEAKAGDLSIDPSAPRGRRSNATATQEESDEAAPPVARKRGGKSAAASVVTPAAPKKSGPRRAPRATAGAGAVDAGF